jgi:hypothetical protein
MTTIDDELKALDEAYLKKLKDLFGILFENISAKDADALKHFDNGCKLLREARGYARNMITGADHESPAHRTGPPRAQRKKSTDEIPRSASS